MQRSCIFVQLIISSANICCSKAQLCIANISVQPAAGIKANFCAQHKISALLANIAHN